MKSEFITFQNETKSKQDLFPWHGGWMCHFNRDAAVPQTHHKWDVVQSLEFMTIESVKYIYVYVYTVYGSGIYIVM